MDRPEKLGQDRLNVLVVEDNEYMQSILLKALRRLGFETLVKAKNGKEAIEHLKMTHPSVGAARPVDIVVCDLVMSPINGIILLQWLRTFKESPNRFMPFIMVSGAADAANVQAARDQGMHEFMAKPFSVDALYKTLQRLIDKPRQFIVTQKYCGPDRRRRKAESLLGPEQRAEGEDHATIVYSKDKVAKPEKASDVWIFKLPNHLKEKMGSNAMRQEFIVPDTILAEAEAALQREAAGFLTWAKVYLDNLSKEVTEARTLVQDRNKHFDEINLIAHELRGQGGTFGYPLITLFAKSLYESTKEPRKEDDAALDIAKAHIDTMRAVIREDIEGDGGELGQQLFKSLKLAIAKHEKRGS